MMTATSKTLRRLPKNNFGHLIIRLGILVLLAGSAACSEIFEIDITNKALVLTAPADSSASRSVSQTFRWQPLEGAREYRLEVASPSLAEPSDFFLDTVTRQTSLRLVLKTGRFEWRLTARNAGYESASVGRLLRIDSSSNLAEQSFRLLTPGNNAVLGSSTVRFTWEALPMANKYILQLSGSTPDTVFSNQHIKTLPVETRSYSWLVTAINATSRKTADQAFAFSVDTQNPSVPALSAPANNALLQTLPVTLVWQRGGSGIVRDSVYLYSANQTLLSGFPQAVSNSSYRIERSTTDLGTGTYYWSVKSVGNNGRTSDMSERRGFSLQF
jgi:hypothetical protein